MSNPASSVTRYQMEKVIKPILSGTGSLERQARDFFIMRFSGGAYDVIPGWKINELFRTGVLVDLGDRVEVCKITLQQYHQ